MKDIEKAVVEKQKLFKRLLTVAVKQIVYGGMKPEMLELEFITRFGPHVVNIVNPVLAEASIRERENPVYYCGRCMRFFTIDNFNETNSVKAVSGEGGYCLQCGSQKLETMIDFSTGTVEYIEIASNKAERPSSNGIPFEVKQWTQDPSTENLVRAILSVQKVEERPLIFFEIVVSSDQIETISSFLASENAISTIVKTQYHAIISVVMQRDLTEYEVSMLKNVGKSFIHKGVQFK